MYTNQHLTAFRVQYFRSKLDRKQWQEEIDILLCKLERTFRWFAAMSSTWRSLAEQAETPAHASYCHQAADIYSLRATRCQNDMQAADTASVTYWDHLGQRTSTILTTPHDLQL